ncbi:PGLS [Lepeophtheirus salmonis]|uniref:6-phosphogluconolactonase n=1 Tax=Lepeophtheirus salmonis TaxID=72036 RepID=A0A7R8H2F9_LEPSM|nr:PGLS [Lepeophtheirus salmonis]CAF2813071.1 PGLS [Lepeophtheirus salmonis]
MTSKVIVSENVSQDLSSVIKNVYESNKKNPDEDFVIGLSGGSLPKFFASGLNELEDTINWSKVKFIFCDERLVPYDDGDSTWKIYKETVVGKVEGLDESNFILVDVNLPDAEASAIDYETKVKEYAVKGFDLLLLGMGPDGHTCSLFPGHPLLKEQDRIVAPITDSPKLPPSRVTLTLPYINKSKAVIFVCTGEGKKTMIENVLKKKIEDFPSTLVRPENGELYWILDKPAASNL